MQIHEDLGGIFEDKKEKHRIGTITCAGHSLGAALATLAAYDLAHASCVPNNVKVRLCNFEGPKVGTTLLPLFDSYSKSQSLLSIN